MTTPLIVNGDLLAQDVDVIVNSWNRNIIPWWLLIPQGVSGAIKRRGGFQPFSELGRLGSIPLGGAVQTSAGRLPYKAIIHVAGISMFWRASKYSIQGSVVSAMALVHKNGFKTVAFPVIGAGTGGFGEAGALQLMIEVLETIDSPSTVTIVRYKTRTSGN